MGRENNKVTPVLYQGLARYKKDKLDINLKEHELTNIEPWKVKKIQNFTISIPGRGNMMAICEKAKDISDLYKVAEIVKNEKGTTIRFLINPAELTVASEAQGYLSIDVGQGAADYYKFYVREVPDWADYDGCVAFVDGSGGGKGANKETLEVNDGNVTYQMYGGAYMIYEPGKQTPIADSFKEETAPIEAGLQGISAKTGNVYGEINSAIMVIKKADELGIEKLRVYYDCEQIGGHAPGGAFENHNTAITAKYAKFWENQDFAHLKSIELIHVDAHTTFDLNEAIDTAAKNARDAVKREFELDAEKKKRYLEHAKDYD